MGELLPIIFAAMWIAGAIVQRKKRKAKEEAGSMKYRPIASPPEREDRSAEYVEESDDEYDEEPVRQGQETRPRVSIFAELRKLAEASLQPVVKRPSASRKRIPETRQPVAPPPVVEDEKKYRLLEDSPTHMELAARRKARKLPTRLEKSMSGKDLLNAVVMAEVLKPFDPHRLEKMPGCDF